MAERATAGQRGHRAMRQRWRAHAEAFSCQRVRYRWRRFASNRWAWLQVEGRFARHPRGRGPDGAQAGHADELPREGRRTGILSTGRPQSYALDDLGGAHGSRNCQACRSSWGRSPDWDELGWPDSGPAPGRRAPRPNRGRAPPPRGVERAGDDGLRSPGGTAFCANPSVMAVRAGSASVANQRVSNDMNRRECA